MRHLLHFGPGNFFRAHLAEYLFDAGGWEITAVSLRSTGIRDGLKAQGCAYALAIQGQELRRVDVIRDVLVAPEDPDRILTMIEDPTVEVISATVTEKGYHLRSDGGLDLDDTAIKADLSGAAPRSLIGFLARGLARRSAPVTVLSCDNRNGNGDALARAVREFCDAARLAITCDVSFPNAMVDRITPATTDELRLETGDPMAVPTEPFKEWVIEDRFVTSRPDWPGVQWVSDVAPHEMRKLRMLNGAHSYLAYAGSLAGFDHVHEAIADPNLRAGARALMAEAEATLPPEANAEGYADALIARFENPYLAHKLRQIAMDGSQKLPYRMIEGLRALDGKGPALIAGVRAWIQFCRSETEAGRALDDPRADDLVTAENDEDFLKIIGASDLAPVIAE